MRKSKAHFPGLEVEIFAFAEKNESARIFDAIAFYRSNDLMFKVDVKTLNHFRGFLKLLKTS